MTRVCSSCGRHVDNDVDRCPHDGSQIGHSLERDPALKARYRYAGPIAVGGMGEVHKFHSNMLDRLVAIKVMHASCISEAAIRRFQNEAKALSRLSHPNIVRMLDFGVAQHGEPYLVMDYVDGKTLADVLAADGQIAVERVMSIFVQVCDGLAHAHAGAVLHRDIKPSNIMLVPHGREGQMESVYIMDFGIAKLADGATQLTRTGEAIGSPLYMSPEQVRGGGVDERSDLYSLGCVMYEAITGTPPFSAPTAFEIMAMHANASPASMREVSLGRSVPPRLERVVMRLLSKEPAQRFGSAEDLKQELKKTLDTTLSTQERLKLVAAGKKANPKVGIAATLAVTAVTICGALILYGRFGVNGPSPVIPPVSTVRDVSKATPYDVNGQAPHKWNDDDGRDMVGDVFKHISQRPQLTADELETMLRRNPTDLDLSSLSIAATVTDDTLKPLEHATRVKRIALLEHKIDDGAWRYLKHLPLENVSLMRTRIKSLAPLKNMKNLYFLNVAGTDVDDSELGYIDLPHLRNLDLSQTGVRHLYPWKHMNELEVLSVSDTNLDSEGMKVVGSLPALNIVILEKTKITDNDLDLLKQKQGPSLYIYGCEKLSIDAIKKYEAKHRVHCRLIATKQPNTKFEEAGH